MSDICFVFRTSPHDTSAGREGVDALLAASAFSENLSVVFIGEGVQQLIAGQSTEQILSKDYSPMLKLFDLYDIEKVYACQESLQANGLAQVELVTSVQCVEKATICKVLSESKQVMSF